MSDDETEAACCTCHRCGKMVYEPEFECDVHGDPEAKRAMTSKEHAEASGAWLATWLGCGEG